MKKYLILLLCLSPILAAAQTPIARVKQGESFTFTLNFPSNYDTSRIAKLTAFLGGAEVGDLQKSTIVPLNDSCFRLQLRSSRTALLKGDYAFQIAVEDETVGVKKTTPVLVSFTTSNNTTSSSAVNTGSDVLVKVNILAPGVVANAELATIYKGDTGAPGPAGATGPQGPAGATGAPGPAGSDATVTSGNIASALGYTPVSPALLGTKRDTSASITTAKISDWTAAWAARWASELLSGWNMTGSLRINRSVTDGNYLQVGGNASFYGNVGFGTATPPRTISLSNTSTGIALYNTAEQTTNFEVGRLYWSANVLTLSTEKEGTGIHRGIAINAVGGNVYISAQGVVRATFGSSSSVGMINFSSPSSSGNTSIVGISSIVNSNSGMQYQYANIATLSQSGSAGYVGYYASVYEQALGTGPKLLMDLGINSAANGAGTHTSRFSVTNTGKTTISDDVEITDNTKGLILKSPDNTRYRITVANGGTLVVTAL